MKSAASLRLRSHAKINLCLDVLPAQSEQGYHRIQTVYQEIELHDDIFLQELKKDAIEIRCSDKNIPLDERNLAFGAAKIFKNYSNIKKGIRITIVKRIPIGQGFGGGSSNAATVLKGLNQLWKTDYSLKMLENLAKKIGMDVPFFLHGGTALGVNFGEKIFPLPPLPLPSLPRQGGSGSGLMLIVPKQRKISTKAKYESLDLRACGKNRLKTEKLIEGLYEKNLQKILENIHNDFEQRAHRLFLNRFRLQHGTVAGSGNAVFGM